MLSDSLRERPVAGRLSSGFLWSLLLLATGVGLSLERYTNLTWGNALPNPDVTRMFYPIAEGVAAGGPLYGPGLADNKPPGWQLLNVAAYETGDYTLVLLICVGIANGLTAVLLWRWLSGTVTAPVPVLASALFLLALAHIGGHHINSRSIALLFLVGALVVMTPIKRGVAVALATLFNAYAALFVPVVLWLVWRDAGPERVMAAGGYLAGGAVTGLAAFAGVGLVWGVEATLAALAWSYGLPVAEGVATSAVHSAAELPNSYLARTWLMSHPSRWLQYGGSVTIQLAVVVGLAVVGIYHRSRLESAEHSQTMTVALGAGTLPFLFRTYEQYWLLPLPFLVTFATLGGVVLSTQYLDR